MVDNVKTFDNKCKQIVNEHAKDYGLGGVKIYQTDYFHHRKLFWTTNDKEENFLLIVTEQDNQYRLTVAKVIEQKERV